MDTINETNLTFGGKRLLDLTHEETRKALVEVANEIVRLKCQPPSRTLKIMREGYVGGSASPLLSKAPSDGKWTPPSRS